MKQELPESFWAPKPFELGQSGIISENRAKVAYLDYVSAKDIKPDVPDFNAARLSTHNSLYRPSILMEFHSLLLLGLMVCFMGIVNGIVLLLLAF